MKNEVDNQNRYMDNIRVDYLLDKWTKICTYSPPDDVRVEEHKKVNLTILASMRILITTCPDTELLDLALKHLWEARNCANGALAVGDLPLEPTELP